MALTEPINALLAGVKANPRLRLGLWLIVCIVWFYGILLLRDEARLAVSEQQALARKLARIQAQTAQTEWMERAESARARQLDLEERLWRESTIGLAQATFQDWLNQAVQQASLTHPAVTVAAMEENAGGETETRHDEDIWKVSAKLGFDFSQKGFYTLMGRLATHDKQIVVETLTIRGEPAPRAEMVLVAHFQKPAVRENGSGISNKPGAERNPG